MTGQRRLLVASLTLSAISLGSCGVGGGSGGSSPAPADNAKIEKEFGSPFASAYRADPNSAPYVPKEGDLSPVSFTADPVPL